MQSHGQIPDKSGEKLFQKKIPIWESFKSPTKVLTVPEIFILPRKRPMTDIFFPNPYMEEV